MTVNQLLNGTIQNIDSHAALVNGSIRGFGLVATPTATTRSFRMYWENASIPEELQDEFYEFTVQILTKELELELNAITEMGKWFKLPDLPGTGQWHAFYINNSTMETIHVIMSDLSIMIHHTTVEI